MSSATSQSFPALTLDMGDLLLRPFEPRDVDGIVDGCSDAVTQHWLPLPLPYTRQDAQFFIDTAEDFRASGEGIRCAITRSEDDTLVGHVSVKKTDWRERVTDVGYWCRAEHRGNGYMTRATRALSLWVLDQGMERVELRAAPANDSSNRVAEAAGFTFEGTMRNAGFIHAGRVDLNLYSLIRSDRAMAG